MTRLVTSIFGLAYSNIFWICSNMKKSGCFTNLFWTYNWSKTPVIDMLISLLLSSYIGKIYKNGFSSIKHPIWIILEYNFHNEYNLITNTTGLKLKSCTAKTPSEWSWKICLKQIFFISPLQISTFCNTFKLVQRTFCGGSITFLEYYPTLSLIILQNKASSFV